MFRFPCFYRKQTKITLVWGSLREIIHIDKTENETTLICIERF